jgi:DNA-binding CsgD family transcriptional regulator
MSMEKSEQVERINVYVVTRISLLWLAIKAALESESAYGQFTVKHGYPSWLKTLQTGKKYWSNKNHKAVIVTAIYEYVIEDNFDVSQGLAFSPLVILNVESPKSQIVDSAMGLCVNKIVVEFGVEPEELIKNIRDVATGNIMNAPQLHISDLEPIVDRHDEIELQILTEREIEVLSLISKGATNEKIASELFISMNTVKTHVRNILRKLKVSTRTQAALMAKDYFDMKSGVGA